MTTNDPAVMDEMLRTARNVAVVGMSDKPARASHNIGRYLGDHGYHVLPVNPMLREVLGKPCYPDLDAAQAAAREQTGAGIDLVNVFSGIGICAGDCGRRDSAGPFLIYGYRMRSFTKRRLPAPVPPESSACRTTVFFANMHD